jgi:23S rRNA pseudouridine955/2504/2580 synthase
MDGPVPTEAATPAVAYHEVDSEHAGQRLDNFLLARLKGVPRSHVYRLIRSGQVRVNKGRSTARYRLQAGDQVRVPPVRHRSAAQAPPGDPQGLDWLAQRIVAENDRFLVLDKPAGLAVHGGTGLTLGCIEALRSLRPGLKTLELVHRLDRMTSGLLLVAKRRSALRTLHEMFRSGTIGKHYLALVAGDWQRGTVRVDAPLAPAPPGARARIRVDPAGKPSVSEFRLIERLGVEAALVEVGIATGRTHQIRVHAAHLGHPVAGDERYGSDEFNARLARAGLKRLFLHAHRLEFEWPDGSEVCSFSSPLPEELKRVLDRLGG